MIGHECPELVAGFQDFSDLGSLAAHQGRGLLDDRGEQRLELVMWAKPEEQIQQQREDNQSDVISDRIKTRAKRPDQTGGWDGFRCFNSVHTKVNFTTSVLKILMIATGAGSIYRPPPGQIWV